MSDYDAWPALRPGRYLAGEEEGQWGSWAPWGGGGLVLAPCWCCFDLSLMSSQHMAAPSAPQGPARLPAAQLTDSATAARSEKSQFPHCTVRFTRGNHISLGEPQAAPPCPGWPAATGTDGGTAPAPSAPHFPPPGDPKSPRGLSSAVACITAVFGACWSEGPASRERHWLCPRGLEKEGGW